jgi:hypothetical protein
MGFLPNTYPCGRPAGGERPRAVALREVELVRNSVLSDTLSTTTKNGQAKGYRAWRTAS